MRMRVLTISDADDEGEDEAEPLLVAQVSGDMIRRVLALIVDELAAPPAAPPNLRVLHGKPPGTASD